jgi:hypothetical protein
VSLASIVPVYSKELAISKVLGDLIKTIEHSGSLNVLLLPSPILLTSRVPKTIRHLFVNHRFQDLDVVLITIGCLVAALGLLADLIVLQGRKD